MPESLPQRHLERTAWRGRAGRVAGVFVLWGLVALIFSGFGYIVSLRRGALQPWWPSFGYSLAIFSVWALITLPMAAWVSRIEAHVRSRRRLILYALGLPVVCTVHVFAFAAIYWPLYNDGGRIPTRWAMGERMLLANLDTNVLFYALLVGGFAAAARRRRPDVRPGQNGLPDVMPGHNALPNRDAEDKLTIRSRGGFLRLPLDAIDRIEAAGDYCEVHAAAAVHLLDEPLSSLAARLPADRFARVHRRTIVALERVAGSRGVGRGDAILRLTDGTEVRLSRRYRHDFEARLGLR